MDLQMTPEQEDIRRRVHNIANRFPNEYWAERDAKGEFPTEFYNAFAHLDVDAVGGDAGLSAVAHFVGIGASADPYRMSSYI